MALIECPDCHKRISASAAACIHCGRPLAVSRTAKPAQTTRTGGKWEAAGFLMMLGGFAAAATQSTTGIALGMIGLPGGFIVFLIGRFK